ncbi:DUF4386 domain-containing protein [Chloroflexi bacterium TSY]|nr:DUF4386 domain-containing protein [Chloroflexi bacterium TSY]
MTHQQIRRTTGTLLILGAIFVNIPYTLLISTFDYPDILRAPTADILTQFAAGGSRLIWTWLAFAWVGLPILLGILLLPQALADDKHSRGLLMGKLALFFGATGAIVQMVGLLRWPFVVPVLARLYTAPEATKATQEAVAAVFQAVHQYGGVVLGEHIGQTFTILWMIFLSICLLQQGTFPRWLSWAGFVAAGVYVLAQAGLLETAMPGFPVWREAGLIGSLLWLGWLGVLGITLLRQTESITYAYAGQNPQHSANAL